MYQKSSGLTKFILMICDSVCIALSLLIADYLWHDFYKHAGRGANYTNLCFVLVGVHFVLFLFIRAYGDFYIRGMFVEAVSVVKSNFLVILASIVLLFFLKMKDYSRMVFALFVIIDCILMWVAHQLLKKILPYLYNMIIARRKTIVVGDNDFVENILREISITKDYATEIVGVCYLGENITEHNNEFSVISSVGEITDFCRKESVDEAIVEVHASTRKKLMPIMDELGSAGIIVKYRQEIPVLDSVDCQAVNVAGNHLVVTYATRSVSTGKLIIKRAFDIFAGVIGCLVTLVLICFLGPVIKLESKGPILFSQKRVGRNGRIFTIYKFRSMYADAEERKAELMKQNQMDGLVFKMDNDPRVTKVGKFIRKTSIDEFPQFFNVLNGDMSMVGTRPPTLDEFEEYNLSQKGRLSFRPGLTGLWQVSGRNNIKNFEDIVALDKQYIREWSPLLDLKIILKTIPAMLSGK